jgi:hypothetical protein
MPAVLRVRAGGQQHGTSIARVVSCDGLPPPPESHRHNRYHRNSRGFLKPFTGGFRRRDTCPNFIAGTPGWRLQIESRKTVPVSQSLTIFRTKEDLFMASYREHITFSGLLGAALGGSAWLLLGFRPVQAAVAGMLTWVSGMLPDLDSESGRPVREVFGVVSVLAPLLLLQNAQSLGMDDDRAMLYALLTWAAVRYGGAELLNRLTVHRGMFHSIPAMLIAAEVTFLAWPTQEFPVRTLMAVAVAVGFLSHLVLDELYSVQWDGGKVKLAKSSGSALKFFGTEAIPNAVTMGLLLCLSYVTLVQSGLIPDPGRMPAPEELHVSEELTDAPLFQLAVEPRETETR